MANNYTQFSVEFDVGSAENVEKAMKIFNDRQKEDHESYPDDGGWLGISVDNEVASNPANTALWINSGDESGNPEAAIDFVTTVGKALKLKGKWGFSWADTCSKLRLNEFGGGAAVVDLKTGHVEFVNTYEWLHKKLNRKRAA